jgi:hypothetical protein
MQQVPGIDDMAQSSTHLRSSVFQPPNSKQVSFKKLNVLQKLKSLMDFALNEAFTFVPGDRRNVG